MNSVKSQTFTDGIECILVEDCGQDDSARIIEQYIGQYTGNIDFRLLKQNRNQGPSAARNRGVREAKGEYVFFLDADDIITPDCLEVLYVLAKKYNADYVQGRYKDNKNGDGNRSIGLPEFLANRKDIKRLLLNHNKIHFTSHNRLVKRKLVIDNNLFFHEEIKVREDFLWMTFVAKYVERFASCDKPTYCRGYNDDSLTNNINLEREIKGYRVLIETMVENYDTFQLGAQKELALEALLMALRAKYYQDEADRQQLIGTVMSKNTTIENGLLWWYLKTNSSKVLHLLTRYYKRRD